MPAPKPVKENGRTVQPLLVRDDVTLPIYWLNEEWAVTEYGLESLCPESWYSIDKLRLNLVREDRAEWPAQMEGKGWTDPRLFLEAFFMALQIHDIRHSFNREDELSHAAEAADTLVAYREVARRRAAKHGSSIVVMSANDVMEEENLVEQLLDEGVRAPEFPESCIDRR